MEPYLEVVEIRRDESFKAWVHGYPFRTVRWHFHPEYELHHVGATHGRYFIGEFQPGNLVLTGPNLPHNWISDLPQGATVPLRCRIVHFSEDFIGQTMALLPELTPLSAVLQKSRHGALFSPQTAKEVGPRLEALIEATGARRMSFS